MPEIFQDPKKIESTTENENWKLCTSCGSHLGWNFESVSGSGSFLALILGRITS